MPVKEVVQNGKTVGYRYGDIGKIYTIAEYGNDRAKYLAIMQALAIRHSQEQAGRKTDEPLIQ